MNTLRAAAILVALTTFLGGCSSLRTPVERSTIFDRNGTDLVVDHQNGISHTFKSANDADRGCRSPSPDVVMGSSSAFSESVPLKLMGSEQASASKQFDTAMLGGRSPSVLISREILFRGCELASNHQLSTEQALALFRDSLDKIAVIVQTTRQEVGTAAGSSEGSASSVLTPPAATPQSTSAAGTN